MRDIKEELDIVIKTGKVVFGAKKVKQMFLNGNPKLLFISKNCPNEVLDEILYYAKLAKIPYITLDKSSGELGSLCGKPFSVSSFCILDEGESAILDFSSK